MEKMEEESIFDCDAPMFCDFTQADDVGIQMDEWFDTHTEEDDQRFIDMLKNQKKRHSAPTIKTFIINDTSQSSSETHEPSRSLSTEESCSSKKIVSSSTKKKIVQDLHAPSSKGEPVVDDKLNGNESKRIESVEVKTVEVSQSTEVPPPAVSSTESDDKVERLESVTCTEDRLRSRRRSRSVSNLPIGQTLLSAGPVHRPIRTRSKSADRCVGTPSSADAHTHRTIKALKLPLPKTPEVLKRSKARLSNSKSKTSEQLELERIEVYRAKLRQTRQVSDNSFRKALKPSGPHNIHSINALTVPREFHFKTDERIKPHTMETRQDEIKPFPSQLRIREPSPNRTGVTVTKPFHFHESRKRKIEGSASSSSSDQPTREKLHKPMAEIILDFQNKTPPRFHTTSSKETAPNEKRPSPMKVTHPKSPQLRSRDRKRPVNAVSAAEVEQKQVDEMKSYHFKAGRLDPKILQRRSPGIKMSRQQDKAKVVPVAFNLHTNKRIQERTKPQELQPKPEFHAKPIPAHLFEGPSGLPAKTEVPATLPQSPAFALKLRVALHKNTEPEKVHVPIIKAKAAPNLSVPFKPVIDRKITESIPFSFHTHDKERLEGKEEKIKHQIDEETKIEPFKAKPMPDSYQADTLPTKITKPVTKPIPFTIEDRSTLRSDDGFKKTKLDISQGKEGTLPQFKAKPPTVLHKEPFKPEPSKKPPTEIKPLLLNTDRRLRDRQCFTNKLKEKENLIEQLRKTEAEMAQVVEETVRAQLRDEMVHKAQPVKHYKTVLVHHSEQSLTVPESPAFSLRLKQRAEQNNTGVNYTTDEQ